MLAEQPVRIRGLFERVQRQIIELRKQAQPMYEALTRERQGVQALELIRRLLGRPSERSRGGEADDRSSGHPMRRFAEFGILPGYEFPAEPATLRLLGDPHEDEPIAVERRFGIAQYQPDAIVHARGRRWRVFGLDRASPWNPENDAPTWLYVVCGRCGLRVDAQGEPVCRRCGSSDLSGKPRAGYELAGFAGTREDAAVIDEEERISKAGVVRCDPQWDGEVMSTYLLANGWQAELRRGEEVRWLNEARPQRGEKGESGPGFSLCPACGNLLTPEEESNKKAKVNRAPRREGAPDPFGHSPGCRRSGRAPEPFALTTRTPATTLRILVELPVHYDANDYERFGLSLGYALRTGMRHLYMLDGSEIEFELEPSFPFRDEAGSRRRGSLTFLDPAVGGSGFLERAAAELHLVAAKAIDHLTHQHCETACYRCLKSYQNQRFHNKLSWPHALPALEALAQKHPVRRPGRSSDLRRVRAWIEAYEAGVGSPLELRFLRVFEATGLKLEKQYAISLDPGRPPLTYADFAMPEERLAIYVDGAGFHVGRNLRRDRYIRARLRAAEPPWRVEELTASDLADGIAKLADLLGQFPKEAPEPPSQPEPAAGTVMHMVLASQLPEDERFFGDYELLVPLSPGGMAEVFKARIRATGDLVFLKRVHMQSKDADPLNREMEIYQKLQWQECTHVLQVYGFVREGDYAALVTELADGGDLASYVKEKPEAKLQPDEGATIARAVTAGVAELHRSRVVHRDIKPENVLLSGGVWKIADFGIAKNQDRYGGGRTFQKAGTTAYAAPEQIVGVEADPSADIFSLGKLFTFLLTGTTLLDRVPGELVAWKDLIRRMTSEEVERRPLIEAVQDALRTIRAS